MVVLSWMVPLAQSSLAGSFPAEDQRSTNSPLEEAGGALLSAEESVSDLEAS